MSELREALEAAVEQETPNEPSSTPEVQTAAPEAPAPVADSTSEAAVSDETKDKPDAAEAAKADDAGKKAEVPADRAVETAEQKLAHRVDRPPTSWKKEAKGEWATVPLHIRQEVHRREAEVNRVLNETAPLRQQMAEIERTIQPYMARVQSLGATPIQAMESFFKADYMLATAPKQQRAQFMAKLIADYDIDLQTLDNALVESMNGKQAPQQQAPGFDPNQIQQLVQQQLNQALAPIYQQRQQQEQQVVEQAKHSVETMGLDPKYPYFDVVREDMADLIEMQAKRGIALSLEDAYDRAVRINPETVEQMAQQTSMAQANQQHQLAQKAKLAASSVTGAPAAGGSQQYVGDGSMRGAIEAAFSGARV